MENLVYNERQKYSNGFLGLVALPMLITIGIWFLNNIDPNLSRSGFYIVLGVNCLISVGLLVLFRVMTMEVRISGDYIFVLYKPFRNKPLMIHKSDIENWKLRNFKPIMEYGGIGYRKRKGIKKPEDVSYTIKGNIGLQLELKDGSRILLGVQRRQAMDYAMRKWMEDK